MRKQFAISILLMLVFASAVSSALARRSSSRASQSAAVRQEKRLGPKPTPHWYWRWIDWRLGEGYAKGQPKRSTLRPNRAPAHIHPWAWRRLHFFLLARGSNVDGPVTNGGESYRNLIAYTRQHPTFTPTRTVKVSNASELQAALANLQPGDRVTASRRFTVSGITVIKNRLSSPAELDLSGVRFLNSSGANHPAVWLNNAQNLYIYGGDISTADTGGVGLLVHGSQHILWWGFKIHDTGSTGLGVRAISGPVDHDDFQGEISKIGQNIAWDTHCGIECGTGLHGANLWDGNTDGNFTNNRFALYAHDLPTGACVSMGNDSTISQAQGNLLYLKCVNENEVSTKQTGGNGLQLWGDTDKLRLDVKYLEVEHVQGRALDTQGLYPGRTLTGVTVEYGHATKTNLNPRYAGQSPWDSYGGVAYRRVRPAR